ncbi:DgyrCDS9288 [Dimorphilus gyrociliatus]|uniref:DgyrCDS9288 n=1 Tax=Dimorphilus gyrociliatus TaxID=2664684 RepID=A0A7I8VY17_9ANNE|nr:DgyrCDS9288 [Dimorphilus gyrociliatus]
MTTAIYSDSPQTVAGTPSALINRNNEVNRQFIEGTQLTLPKLTDRDPITGKKSGRRYKNVNPPVHRRSVFTTTGYFRSSFVVHPEWLSEHFQKPITPRVYDRIDSIDLRLPKVSAEKRRLFKDVERKLGERTLYGEQYVNYPVSNYTRIIQHKNAPKIQY